MIGKRPAQKPLFEVGNVFDLKLAPKSFHAQLALAAPRLFKDEDFAAFYKDKQGRPSVPPYGRFERVDQLPAGARSLVTRFPLKLQK